jgi:hypothetical protein
MYWQLHKIIQNNYVVNNNKCVMVWIWQLPLDVTSLSIEYMRVYPKVSGLATWSKNCKWYSSLPLGTVVSLLCESV